MTPQELLALVPQQRPFRFVDEILEVDDEHIVGRYTWRREDCLFLPGQRLVPQSMLVEMAAQIGTVAWCIWHLSSRISRSELERLVGVFTEIEHARFHRVVREGMTLECVAQLGDEGYFRGSKLVSEVSLSVVGGKDDGQEVFSGLLSGMFVPKNPEPAA